MVFAAVLGGFLLEKGNLYVLLQPAELLIVGGAAAGIVMVANPPSLIRRMWRGTLAAFRPPPYNPLTFLRYMRMLYEIFSYIQRAGVAEFEKDVENPGDSRIFHNHPDFLKDAAIRAFVCDSLRMVVVGVTTPSELDQLMELDIEAQRRDDPASARAYAEEAARTSPALAWAGKAVLEFRCATGDWAGALALLERNKRALDKASYRRQRAVMLTARALTVEETDRDSAKLFALEAAKLAPELVPAAALAGRMLAEGGELRRASRIIDKAWRANPHPDLARTYADLRFGDAARDRLRRIENLAKKAPGHLESALALGRAALDAREFAKARAALTPCLAAPTRRVALLMAALERTERGDEGRAREWVARALNAAPDPAWTDDGYVSDRWLPVSPVTGRLDAFEWRVPLAGIVNAAAPVIEPEPAVLAPVPAPVRESAALPAQSAAEPPASAAEPAPAPARRGVRRSRPKPEAVIPLVHAPDDPGPEAVQESEPNADTQNGSWRKLFE